jgi:hypothetical protein
MARYEIKDRELERQGQRMLRPAVRFLLLGCVLAVPGIVLVAGGWVVPLGAVLLAFASLPIAVAVALLASSSVARWAARHKLFA